MANSRLRMKRNRIKIENPDIKSQASLVLLTKQLRDQEIEDWLKFRDDFLNDNELICHYCGKKNLLKEVDMTNKSELSILATIDHVKPLSKGGHKFEKSNCVVSCFPCNHKKGNNEL